MLKKRARLVAGGLMFTDLLTISASFLAAYYLRSVILPAHNLVGGALMPASAYAAFLGSGVILWGISLVSVGAYASHRTRAFTSEAWEVSKASCIAGLLLIVMLFVTKLDERLLAGDRLSRALIVFWMLFAMALLVAERLAIRMIARSVRRRGHNYRNILVLGTSDLGRRIAHAIQDHGHWGLHVVGFVTEQLEDPRERLDGLPILASWDRLLQLTENHVVDEVIIAAPELAFETTHELVNSLRERGICARLSLLESALGEHPKVDHLGTIPLLSFESTSVSDLALVAKRCVDLAVSVPLAVALLPVIAVTAVAIRVSSAGPSLFRQTRVGLRGRRFDLLKFRTMQLGAERDRGELEHRNEMSGPVFKLRNDPRVTRLGRFLRRFSLDELAQLWNVIKGDMSLVGPRPPTPEEVEQYKPWQRRRLSMRPGLTCLWQVGGRNEIDFDRWVALDLEYIDNWTPWLDIKILLRTLPAVLSGRGAF